MYQNTAIPVIRLDKVLGLNNKNSDFKMAIQYSKQEIEDLNMLLKLTEEIK